VRLGVKFLSQWTGGRLWIADFYPVVEGPVVVVAVDYCEAGVFVGGGEGLGVFGVDDGVGCGGEDVDGTFVGGERG
jgi:hypothetical protein